MAGTTAAQYEIVNMKIPVGDRQVEANRVPFDVEEDHWQVLRAADGTVVRLKPVVTDLFKTTEVGPDGAPVFVVRTQVVVATEVPDSIPTGGT